MSLVRVVLGLGFLAAVAGACALPPPGAAPTPSTTPTLATSSRPSGPAMNLTDLAISNGTTLTVTLVVNGTWQQALGPHSGAVFPAGDLAPLPWYVVARSPSGRVLVSMTVRAGDVFATMYPDGHGETRGAAVRADLSCGRLDVWSGPPMSGPAPGTGIAGDCSP